MRTQADRRTIAHDRCRARRSAVVAPVVAPRVRPASRRSSPIAAPARAPARHPSPCARICAASSRPARAPSRATCCATRRAPPLPRDRAPVAARPASSAARRARPPNRARAATHRCGDDSWKVSVSFDCGAATHPDLEPAASTDTFGTVAQPARRRLTLQLRRRRGRVRGRERERRDARGQRRERALHRSHRRRRVAPPPSPRSRLPSCSTLASLPSVSTHALRRRNVAERHERVRDETKARRLGRARELATHALERAIAPLIGAGAPAAAAPRRHSRARSATRAGTASSHIGNARGTPPHHDGSRRRQRAELAVARDRELRRTTRAIAQ